MYACVCMYTYIYINKQGGTPRRIKLPFLPQTYTYTHNCMHAYKFTRTYTSKSTGRHTAAYRIALSSINIYILTCVCMRINTHTHIPQNSTGWHTTAYQIALPTRGGTVGHAAARVCGAFARKACHHCGGMFFHCWVVVYNIFHFSLFIYVIYDVEMLGTPLRWSVVPSPETPTATAVLCSGILWHVVYHSIKFCIHYCLICYLLLFATSFVPHLICSRLVSDVSLYDLLFITVRFIICHVS